MSERIESLITYVFYFVIFFVPLVLYPYNSELFEFNKILLTYVGTILIVFLWGVKMLTQRKILFRRTILDIPLLIFLGAQIISTLTSVDIRTSLLGYYSRFNGGLVSLLSYSLLYWAWVSNMDREKTNKAIKILLASAFLVSIYGFLQHFGIDREIWVQDVQNRIFSTLGQPNWLAAWIIALLPLTWALTLKSKKKWPLIALSSFFFLNLLYTKSRSGLLAFLVVFVSYWVFEYWLVNKLGGSFKKLKKTFFIYFSIVLLLVTVVGTPWSKSFDKFFSSTPASEEKVAPTAPALETGGTESGEIRKIVWRGAFDIFKANPLFGTGVETFGISYYGYRPIEHNLVSEWDFLYNKAHNEYLNIAATTGLVGLAAYLFLVRASILLFITKKRVALLFGYISILVTNFFGFSVVPVSLLFFLFPAIAISLDEEEAVNRSLGKLAFSKNIGLSLLAFAAFYSLTLVGKYWYADLVYARGELLADSGRAEEARDYLLTSVSLSENEALFWDELSLSSADMAVAFSEAGELEKASEFEKLAISESDKAISLAPNRVNIKRNRASLFLKLSIIDNTYLFLARDSLLAAVELAPTDAKLYYNLGLTEARAGQSQTAIELLKETINLKANYRNARFALAILLAEEGMREEAIGHLEYILEKINPDDNLVKQQLEEYR